MALEKVIPLITQDSPSPSTYKQAVFLIENLGIENLWKALTTPSVCHIPANQIFITLLSKVLREKIVAQNIGSAANSIVGRLQK